MRTTPVVNRPAPRNYPKQNAQQKQVVTTRHDDFDYFTQYHVISEHTPRVYDDFNTHGHGGNFGGGGASGSWDDSASRAVATAIGSAIGSAVATAAVTAAVTAVTNSFREETPTYTQQEQQTKTYSFDSDDYRTPSYEPSGSGDSGSYSSDW